MGAYIALIAKEKRRRLSRAFLVCPAIKALGTLNYSPMPALEVRPKRAAVPRSNETTGATV
jgi:hypothetical protein